MKRILFTLLTLSFIQVSAQNYADEEFYLVDSLDFSEIGYADSVLVDSCMKLYHSGVHDSVKMELISEIVETSWDDNVWPKYNEVLFYQTSELLEKHR